MHLPHGRIAWGATGSTMHNPPIWEAPAGWLPVCWRLYRPAKKKLDDGWPESEKGKDVDVKYIEEEDVRRYQKREWTYDVDEDVMWGRSNEISENMWWEEQVM